MIDMSSFKRVVAAASDASFLQSLAGVLFVIFFVIMVVKAYSKPKNYYHDMGDLPLDKENNTNKKDLT